MENKKTNETVQILRIITIVAIILVSLLFGIYKSFIVSRTYETPLSTWAVVVFSLIAILFILLFILGIRSVLELTDNLKKNKIKKQKDYFNNENNQAKCLKNKRVLKKQSKKEYLSTKKDIEKIQKIKEKQQLEKKCVMEEKLKTAIEYSKRELAPYTSIENLERLLINIEIYAKKESFKNIKPINIKELTVKDLKHFGWNIWNHFDTKTNQKQIAVFLKKTFPNTLKNIKNSSLKHNLKVDEKEGLIKIRTCLSKSETNISN